MPGALAVPEMMRAGYNPRFAVGVCAGSSVLGMLIPPSLLMILYGVLTETSVGDLFTSGIIPGILLSLVYSVGILVMAYRYPTYVGEKALAGDNSNSIGILAALWKLVPILALAFLVVGGLHAGWFTPTESGAVGALGAFLLSICKRVMTPRALWEVLLETGHVTVAILFLIICANIYGRMLSMSGIMDLLGTWMAQSGLSIISLTTIYVIIVLLMGTVLDSASIMMIIVPLVYPAIHAMQIDLVWFGLITVIAIEVGLLTPPLGVSVYVVKATLDDQNISLSDVFAGAFPFVLMMILVLILIIIFPSISLVLVR